ncbi:MAG: hypothetical protein ACR2NZ_16855 [Rubripirellula sp.]
MIAVEIVGFEDGFAGRHPLSRRTAAADSRDGRWRCGWRTALIIAGRSRQQPQEFTPRIVQILVRLPASRVVEEPSLYREGPLIEKLEE